MIRVIVIILLVTCVMLVISASVPVNITKRMIYNYKEKMLISEAETISSSLSGNQVLTTEGTQEVMAVLGSSNDDVIVITDSNGLVLYSTETASTTVDSYALYPEIISALDGNDAFKCVYDGSSFVSTCAMPVIRGGNMNGCVYIEDTDSEQAALLVSIRAFAFRMSFAAIGISLILYLVFGVLIVRKNRRMLESMRMVREGDYAYRLEVKGRDEYTVLADEFNRLTSRLQETEQKRRQFVSDASHELRTPLAAIKLLADSVVQNDMDGETVKDFVKDISSEADRLTRMTSKLLNLTALDSRKFAADEPEPVNLADCCKKAVRVLSPLAESQGKRIEESTEDICLVLGRVDDMFQLVMNLAENGIKYSGEDGLVRIIAYTQGEHVILIVEDNGVGIPEAELERIFERFYRVDKARSREAGGTGLGLAIVRETVESFGGTVSASNRPQGGARFTVSFPRLAWEGE